MADNNGNTPNPWGKPPKKPRTAGGRPEIPQDFNQAFGKVRDTLSGFLPGGNGGFMIPLILVLGIWIMSGVYFVQPAESSVIQRFGAWERTQNEPGIGIHMPWPVESHTIVNTQLDRRLSIGFTGQNSSRTQAVPSESLMLTKDANIVDINVVVLWNIASAENYLFNVVSPETTIKQVAESAIREAVGQAPLQKIITSGRDDVAVQIQTKMQTILDTYTSGISVKQVLIQEATVHPDVLEAFDDVVAARQDAERFQNEASIYSNDIIPKARGEAIKLTQAAEAYKESQVAKAEGDAARFDEVYAAYQSGRDVTKDRIFIETMESILGNAQTFIVDKNAGQGTVPILPLGNSLPSQPRTTGGQ